MMQDNSPMINNDDKYFYKILYFIKKKIILFKKECNYSSNIYVFVIINKYSIVFIIIQLAHLINYIFEILL